MSMQFPQSAWVSGCVMPHETFFQAAPVKPFMCAVPVLAAKHAETDGATAKTMHEPQGQTQHARSVKDTVSKASEDAERTSRENHDVVLAAPGEHDRVTDGGGSGRIPPVGGVGDVPVHSGLLCASLARQACAAKSFHTGCSSRQGFAAN